MTDVDRKTKNIVVRCLRPYKGYGLLREREREREREIGREREKERERGRDGMHLMYYDSAAMLVAFAFRIGKPARNKSTDKSLIQLYLCSM